MGLEHYQSDMKTCCRCSACKFIPLEKVIGYQYVNVCPSIARYNFHAYSGGGRMAIGVAMLEKRLKYTDDLLEVLYDCQMCGGCDVSCKYAMDMEVLDPINEQRIECVEKGHTLPALDKVVTSMRKLGTMVAGAKAKRGDWAKGLKVKDVVKEKAKVVYHAGCRVCYDKDMWQAAQDNIALLQKGGVDVGIMGEEEICCGSRAYQMGYKEDFLKQAKENIELIKKTGAETIVMGCADCYYAYKVLYEKFGMKGKLKVVHATEYLAQLIKEGNLKPTKKVNAKVTYHDPCHLGRLGEPYIQWKGKLVPGHVLIYEPPKEFRRGTYGVYEPPREVLGSITGIKVVEMARTKEYAWCCGAGGGVKESNADFAMWTAKERIREAEASNVEALVTACPGCERIFKDAIQEIGSRLKVYDIAELVKKAV